jgi:hypothetical protein
MNNLAELQKERDSLKNKLKQLNERISEFSRKELQEKLSKIFEQFPSVKSFAWKQFTDYWNDGNACHFHVHDDSECITINNKSMWDMNEEELSKEEVEAQDAISDIISKYDKKDMERMFGDHVEVCVNKDKIEVNDYNDHD